MKCNLRCETCGPVVVVADTLDHGWPISGICPQCKARYQWHPADAIPKFLDPKEPVTTEGYFVAITIKNPFEHPTNRLSVRRRYSYTEDDMAIAVRAAKEILTSGKCSLILMVERIDDEWFNVLTNVGAFIAAHVLDHPTLTVLEK